MRKALAQNPNLLRTLIGLGLTLIFLLGYAVYGATISTEYYIYSSDSEQSDIEILSTDRYYSPDTESTTWIWDGSVNGINLTWINLTVSGLADDTYVSLYNAKGVYSHPSLGVSDARDFSCSENCDKKIEHEINSSNGVASIISLTDPDPALRGTGTVYADSQTKALEKIEKIISTNFSATDFRITVIEEGNKTVRPDIQFTQVNEKLDNVKPFEIDAATEFVWALAAVIGCFSMVLIPSFTIYFAARAKEKKVELALDEAKQKLEE